MYFLSFLNFAFSPWQGTWLQGYKGRMHSPLVPVHVPMDLQGHFLNSSSRREKNSVPSFVPEFLGFVPIASKPHGCAISQGHFRVCPCLYRYFRDTGTFSGLSLRVRDIPEGHSRVCLSGLSLSLLCP